MNKEIKTNMAIKAEEILSFLDNPDHVILPEDRLTLEKVSYLAQTIVLNFDAASEDEIKQINSLLSIVEKYFSYDDKDMKAFCIESLMRGINDIENDINKKYYI